MSRVEQALRRAGHGTVTTQDSPGLDLYPSEPVVARVARETPVAVGIGDRFRTPSAAVAPESGSRIAEAYRNRLVTAGGAPPQAIEQYRRLAASLHQIHSEQGLRSLMVTSAVPQEGKTLTVVNLALTLSESYKRNVLLIDADLRRPTIHEVFGISNTEGLCDALRSPTGKVRFERVSNRLAVLPAGSLHGDPMSALASSRMSDLLQDAAEQFDWVLLDAPPVALMADVPLLVRLTRAVVFVVGAGGTAYKAAEKAIAEIGRDNIIGAVLNRAEEGPDDLDPYYGYESTGPMTESLAAPPAPNKVEQVTP